jgi:predicted nuclease of predicted toxin-antitoxin system
VARFYLDEHMNPRIAQALRLRGVEAITAQDAGRAGRGIPDPLQLAFAAVHGYVFVSGDWDFLGYSGRVRPHAGVVIIPRHVDIGTAVLYLEIVAASGSAADYTDRLLVCPAFP